VFGHGVQSIMLENGAEFENDHISMEKLILEK
jgi:hypothetical protein